METGPNTSGPSTGPDIFDEFESYRFSDDPEFRAGLPTVISAIRGKERSAGQIDEMIGRAQWFYFTRLKGVTIPWEDYAQRQIAHPYVDPSSPETGLILSRTISPSTPTTTTRIPKPKHLERQEALQTLNYLAEARTMMKDETSTGSGGQGQEEGLSFAMLSRLIAEGRTEEVPMKQIPEGTNEAQPSRAQMQARPKPWEMAIQLPLPPPPPLTTPATSNQIPHAYASSSTNSPNIFAYDPSTARRSSASAATPQSGGTAYSHPYLPTGSTDFFSLPPGPNAGAGQGSYSSSFNPSPNLNPNWATAGPTISPDLPLDAMTFDPDLGMFPNQGVGTGTNGSIYDNQSQFDISAFTSNTSLNLDDYLDVEHDQDKDPSYSMGIGLAPPTGPSAGQSSSSTPASSSIGVNRNGWPTGEHNDTPASSHSL